jgi:hypothetical protein
MSSGASSNRNEKPRSAVSNWWEETPRSARMPSKRTVQVAGVVLDEAEVVVHHGQARIVRGVPDGIPVTIEGDDARAIV